MEMIKDRTVSEIVARNYKAADIFKKYNIDFCCGGGVTVVEACKRKDLNYEQVERELLAIENDLSKTHDFNSWDLDFLIDFIIQTHHRYVKENIPLITQYADKVAKVHGQRLPETPKIRDLFYEIAEELTAHLQKEEQILFPIIKEMVMAKRHQLAMPMPPFGSIQNPIRIMETEHERGGNILKELRNLTSGFTPPEGACTTHRILYAKLDDFERDLHQHIHLENNILFPKAIKLEQ